MTLREKAIIKLVAFLIEFIGQKVDGFYAFKLEDTIRDLLEKGE